MSPQELALAHAAPRLATIGPYRLEARLGAGGMGEVFRALDQRLGRRVALKQIRPEYATVPQARQRFLHEAQVAARLNHPNVAQVYDILDIEDGRRHRTAAPRDEYQHQIGLLHCIGYRRHERFVASGRRVDRATAKGKCYFSSGPRMGPQVLGSRRDVDPDRWGTWHLKQQVCHGAS